MSLMTRIWLVEDDDDIRNCLSMLLSIHGFEVQAFADGGSALKKASDDPKLFWTDLVFLDLYTKAMSAFDFVDGLNALAARFKTSMPKICVVSGAADIEKVSVALSADTFIKKPFDLNDLVGFATQY
jgi:DNA-binding response OmpR family regulator